MRLRAMDAEERDEHDAVLELYMDALGTLFDIPLGKAAVERAVGKLGTGCCATLKP